jgi:hypothetical protein
VILSPSEYVRVLNVAGGDEDDSADEGDMCGEVEEEINLAGSAWQTVVGSGAMWVSVARDVSAGSNVLDSLVEGLGTTYSDEEHGSALRLLSTSDVGRDASSSSRLSKAAFVDWYVFGGGSSESGEGDGTDVSQDASDHVNAVGDSGNWSSTVWAVPPAISAEGVTWRARHVW